MPHAPHAAETSKRRPDIQFLRALAVVSVVAFHFRLHGSGGGFMGVDIFFVISGYLMTKIVIERLERGRFSYLDFVAARAVRIIPALLAMVAVLLVAGAWWLPPFDLKALSMQAWSALFFVSNAYYQHQGGYFDAGVDERWLLHTWSLSVEWQFYLVYPLVLLALWHVLAGRRPADAHRLRTRLVWACGAAFVALFAQCVLVSGHDAARAFFSLATRAWEMLGGALVLLLERPLAQRLAGRAASRNLLFAALLALLLGYMLFAARHNLDEHWPGAWPLVTVALTMALLAVGPHTDAAWIRNTVAQALGRWSYSLYLWHWPLLIALHFAYPEGVLPGRVVAAAIAVTLLLGALSFRWVERPASEASVSWGGARVAFALVLCGLALQAGNRMIERSDGWMARVGPDRPFYEWVAAAKDHAIMPARCINFMRRGADMETCSVGPDSAGPRILVFGDSHAQHLYTWFEAHASRRVDFLASAGCTPAPGFNRAKPGFHCDEYMDRVVALTAQPQYDTIVIAGNWNGGMNLENPSLCRARDGPGCREGVKPTRQELVQANARFWRSLVDAGKQVYVIEQMPFARFNVPDTLARERFWHQPPTLAYPREARHHPYLDDVSAAIGPTPGFVRLDIARALCDADQCHTMDPTGQRPALLDSNHLAPDFVRIAGDVVLAAVR